jgi:ATP-dependent exoDNAse (exonuclease V) alpha subunit
MHRRESRLLFSSPEPTDLTWTPIAIDGPSLAPDNNWEPVATELLRASSANICGSPGTGKTGLVREMMRLATKQKEGFLALAPTNVAMRNMGEGDNIRTIASFVRQWQSAHERGGNSMKVLTRQLAGYRYVFIDEVSMMHSYLYGVFQSVRCNFPSIRLFLVGDFRQLEPVLDTWTGDYQASSSLHWLCDGNRMELTQCRRSDRVLFDAYMNVSTLDIKQFPVVSLSKLHVAYTHKTRKTVNEQCMQAFRGDSETRLVDADPSDPERSQDITLYVGLPLVCWKTKREKRVVVLANSEIWFVTALGAIQLTIQRLLEEVDREAGRDQSQMPTLEMLYEEVQSRFRPGYCITVHMSQGKTFRETYTIHDWDFYHMKGRGQYVALSRGSTHDIVQIAPIDRKRKFEAPSVDVYDDCSGYEDYE